MLATLIAVPRSGAIFLDATDNSNNAVTADALDPPTLLTATSGTSITIDWTATTDTYASGHRIYRATSPGGPYAQIAQVTPRTCKKVCHIRAEAGHASSFVVVCELSNRLQGFETK